ncbi:hypothetical protein [Roseomonas sp. BN140053]|uniref:hypothetical protein n=1 Tax=Roseomonas sp. BN140053 TaxID=3391898 RepID=UPI0039E89706
MISRLMAVKRGAGGKPPAPFRVWLFVLAVLLCAIPAQAQQGGARPPSADSLAGLTILELAGLPDVSPTLRTVVRGRQNAVYRHLHAPGAPTQAANGFAWAWGCDGGDCAANGLFIAHEPGGGYLWLVLIQDGAVVMTVPPRGTRWPPTLVDAVAAVRPELRARL